MKIKSIVPILMGWAIFALTSQVSYSQSISPLGYWQFETADSLADSSAFGHDISLFPSFLVIDSVDGIVGSYMRVQSVGIQPQVPSTLDDSAGVDSVFTIEFWYRPDKDFAQSQTRWTGKSNITIRQTRIIWDVNTSSGSRQLNVDYNGIGVLDPHYLFDGRWHHLVFRFDARSGEQRIFLDGISNAEMVEYHGACAGIPDGGALRFSMGFPWEMNGCLDEYAVYERALPHALIWQHYQDGLNGQHYSQQVTTATLPDFPDPASQSEFNILEFGPEYPNVSETPQALLHGYPAPRYATQHQLRKLVPWITDHEVKHLLGHGSSLAARNAVMRQVLEWLTYECNYYLFLGVLQDNCAEQRATNPSPVYESPTYMDMANDLANAGQDRFLVSSMGTNRPLYLDPSFSSYAYITNQSLPDTFYIRDANGAPLPDVFNRLRWNYAAGAFPNDFRLDSLDIDGMAQKTCLDSTLARLTVPYVDLLGDNDETMRLLSWGEMSQDGEIQGDMAGNNQGAEVFQTGLNGEFREYQAARHRTFKERFVSQYQSYMDSVNQAAGRGIMETWWYDLDGNGFPYDTMRSLIRSRDSLLRAGPHYYPNKPSRAMHTVSWYTGMDHMVKGLSKQLEAGDSLFIPAVSPGFNDGGESVADEEMLRPGQFLGALKGLGALGAESYNLFIYQVPGNLYPGNYRTWKFMMPSYAQAISSRSEEFLFNGRILGGDTSFISSGADRTYYSFNTGNPFDFVLGRQIYGQDRFLISGSIQRRINAVSAGPHEKDVCIRLRDENGAVVYDSLAFEIRLQGSTYVLDLTGADTVFYQLDAWHEWKDPWHWCRDFVFEAEVFDSTTSSTGIHTEVPPQASAGDFSEFTSWLALGPGESASYIFRPRFPEQDSLHFWVRARSQGGGSILAEVDGANTQGISGIGANWEWHSVTLPYTGLDTFNHTLTIVAGSSEVEVDALALKRSADDFGSQVISASVSGDSSVCYGDTTQFQNNSQIPSGCAAHLWRFGDGTLSYEAAPSHVYHFPGTYSVVYALSHSCRDTTVFDTLTVTVDAPLVEAGPDSFACGDSTIVLQGQASGNFHWHADSTLSDTLVLNPIATVEGTNHYYLTATDPQSGCSLTDSVRIQALEFNISYDSSHFICPGQQVQLEVTGGFGFQWSPSGSLSSDTISDPIANPGSTTVYTFQTWDACNCDTLTGQITVEVDTSLRILTPDTSICLGDSLQIVAAGGSVYSWSPANYNISNDSISDPLVWPNVDTSYVVTIQDSGGCFAEDTVHIMVYDLGNLTITYPDPVQCLDSLQSIQVIDSMGFTWSLSPSFVSYSPSNPPSNYAHLWEIGASIPTSYQLSGALPQGGCSFADTFSVSIDSSALGFQIFPGDTTLCQGDSLFYTTNRPADQLQWSNSATTDSVLVIAFASDTLSVIGAFTGSSCFGVDTVLIGSDASCCPIPNLDFFVRSGTASDLVLQNGGSNFQSARIYVQDSLVIDTNVHFTDSRFFMDSMAVIHILEFDTLFSENTVYDTACTTHMWEGIVVENRAAFDSQTDTIRNALNGVVSLEGGDLRLTGTVFSDCHTGVRLDTLAGPHPATFQNCVFQGSGSNLLPPYSNLSKPARGIAVAKVDWASIGDSLNPGTPNLFTRLQIGIEFYRSNGGSFGNEFREMLPVYIQGEPINGTGVGIYAEGEQGMLLSNVYEVWIGAADTLAGNRFDSLGWGIESQWGVNLNVRGNRFFDNEVCGLMVADAPFRQFRIRNNRFTDCANGVLLSLTPGAQAWIESNNIKSTLGFARGVRVADVSTNGQPSNGFASTLYRIAENSIDLAGTGIHVQTAKGVEIEMNDVQMRGAAVGIPFSTAVRVDACIRAKVKDNFLFNAAGLNPAVNVNGNVVADTTLRGLFVQLTDEGEYTCNDIYHFGDAVTFQDQAYDSYIRNNLINNARNGMKFVNGVNVGVQGDVNEPSGNKWLGSFGFSQTWTIGAIGPDFPFWVRNSVGERPIQNLSSLSQGNEVQLPLSTNQIGLTCEELEKGPGDDVEKEGIAAKAISNPNSTDSKQIMDEMYLKGSLEGNPNLASQSPNLAAAEAQLSQGRQEEVFEAQKDLSDANTVGLAFHASALSDSSMVMENLQLGYEMLAKEFTGGIMSLTAGDRLELRAVADLCPSVGGPGVYHSRSILAGLNPLVLFSDACGGFAKRGEEEESLGKIGFPVYPNPATDQVFVDLRGEAAEVQLVDLFGQRVVEEKSIEGNDGLLVLRLDLLATGMYSLHIRQNGQTVQIERLVVE